MLCPHCQSERNSVLDSRDSDGSLSVRRRRLCESCQQRFTTYERYEEMPFMVVKNGNIRELFDRKKIISGFMRACEKRPISIKQIDSLALKIESNAKNKFDSEVPAKDLGEMAMACLKDLDEVAYVRFASVYKSFKDAEEFAQEIEKIKSS